MIGLKEVGCPEDCPWRASNMLEFEGFCEDEEDDVCYCNFEEHPCELMQKCILNELKKKNERSF